MMFRKRSSIKGIGASIFYDVEDPAFNPKFRNGKSGTALRDLDGSLSIPEDASPPPSSQFYDTGDLVALLEGQARRVGDNHRWRVDQTEVTSRQRESGRVQTSGKPPGESESSETMAPAEAWSGNGEGDEAPMLAELASIEETPSSPAPTSIPYGPSQPEGPAAGQTAVTDSPLGDLRALTPEQEERARQRLGDQAFVDLLAQINALYEQVTASLSTREELARRAMDLLSEARDLLLLGEASDFNLAERRLNEVRIILKRVQQTRRWANTYGWGLFAYEMALFGIFIAVLLFDQHIAEWISMMTGTYTVVNGVAQLTKSMSLIFPPWSTMIWGGIGGVVGALYSLHWHVAELQDFDKQYSLWYVVQPLMGLILGGIIHLVVVTGLLALIPATDSGGGPAIALQWFPALVACLAGFRQKFAYEFLDSVMKAVGRQPAGTSTAESK